MPGRLIQISLVQPIDDAVIAGYDAPFPTPESKVGAVMFPELVEVFATPSAPEAEVVRSLLESDDIPVVVRGMTQGPYRMGATYLLVPEELGHVV